MIKVSQLIDRSAASSCGRSTVRCLETAVIAARDIPRSVHFYARVFGFRAEASAERDRHARARLAGPGTLRLVLHRDDAETMRPARAASRLCFRVTDLDAAREALWDAGIAVARDSGEPDQIFRRADGRALYIRDPHGNEIELVEDNPRAACGALRRRCRVARWRRAVRRRFSAAS